MPSCLTSESVDQLFINDLLVWFFRQFNILFNLAHKSIQDTRMDFRSLSIISVHLKGLYLMENVLR